GDARGKEIPPYAKHGEVAARSADGGIIGNATTASDPSAPDYRGTSPRLRAGRNRVMARSAIGTLVEPVATSSAITAPVPGPSWKPWAEKPNWWNTPSDVALGPTTGMPSAIEASMPAQARTMVAWRITGNSSHTVAALIASFSQSSTVSLRSRSGVARWPPPITTVPLPSCLNESLRPRRITTGWMNDGRRLVTISIGAMTVSGTGSSSIAAIRSAQAPAAFTTLGASTGPSLVSTRQTSPTRDRPVTVTPSI